MRYTTVERHVRTTAAVYLETITYWHSTNVSVTEHKCDFMNYQRSTQHVIHEITSDFMNSTFPTTIYNP